MAGTSAGAKKAWATRKRGSYNITDAEQRAALAGMLRGKRAAGLGPKNWNQLGPQFRAALAKRAVEARQAAIASGTIYGFAGKALTRVHSALVRRPGARKPLEPGDFVGAAMARRAEQRRRWKRRGR